MAAIKNPAPSCGTEAAIKEQVNIAGYMKDTEGVLKFTMKNRSNRIEDSNSTTQEQLDLNSILSSY